MLSEEFEELLETGSITVDNNVVISIHEVGELSLDTLKLALYSTLNYLLDSPDGTLPKKYASLFERLRK